MKHVLAGCLVCIPVVLFLTSFSLAENGSEREANLREYNLKILQVNGVDLYEPTDIQVFRHHLYVADRGNNRIVALDFNGDVTATFGGAGSRAGEYISPKSLCITPDSNIVVADVGNKRITSTRLVGSGSTVVDSGFYIFDTAASSHGLVYTGRRVPGEHLLLVKRADQRPQGLGDAWPINHEFESVFRNANTVRVDCNEEVIAVGFPALAVVRLYSYAGDLLLEFFIGGSEVDYIRNEAWHNMLNVQDADLMKERRDITSASLQIIIDDLAALARPHRFGFPSYLSDLKIFDRSIFVLTGSVIHEFDFGGRLLHRYSFRDPKGDRVYLFAFAMDESGRLWGADGVHTYNIYYSDSAGWRIND